jgi:putative Ca2+/H+ antiporter (TMEM165/GDT1 family)
MTTTVLLATAFATVLTAELLGDKTLLALGTLATRYGAAPILAGAIAALAIKVSVAVFLGRAIAQLPPLLLIAVSVATFAMMAITVWRKDLALSSLPSPLASRWHPILISGGGLLLCEWGDPGQITAGLLAAQSNRPGVIWVAATAAMATKAFVAVQLGKKLRGWLPSTTMRTAGVVVYSAMAVLTASGLWR